MADAASPLPVVVFDKVALGAAAAEAMMLDLDSGAFALYDLEQDPSEQHDVAALLPEVAASLREELLAWVRAHPRSAPSRRS